MKIIDPDIFGILDDRDYCRLTIADVAAVRLVYNSIRFVPAGGTWPAAAPPGGVWQGAGSRRSIGINISDPPCQDFYQKTKRRFAALTRENTA